MTSTHIRGAGRGPDGGGFSEDPIDPPTTALPVQRQRPTPPVPAVSVGVFRWLSPALALLAVALLPVAAATTDLEALDGWGLAKVLGPAAWAALLCAVAACAAELWSPQPRIPMLGTATGVLILCSTGMPSVVEPVARFSTAWLLAGFTDSIAQTGAAPPGIDARFYWPAFFAQWAFFRDAGGATQLDAVLRWFPPVVVAVWTIGIYALARSMLGGSRAPWVAAWLFVGLNWIEQDYFSPQATGVVLMVTVLTFALGPLATRRTDPAGVPGWPRAHEDAPRLSVARRWMVSALTPPNRPTLPPRQLLLIYFGAALCLLAAAPEHQITPFAIVGQLVLLAVVGRYRGRGLILVGVMAIVVFILIAGRQFWINQLGLILGSDDQGALQAGVADRLTGDTGQVMVKYLRVLVPGLTWLLAIAGAWTYWKRRRDLVPIGLAVVPMVFAAVQSYGGELILRIVLYGLPILAILATDALRALVRHRGRVTEVFLALGMAVMFCVLVLIRGGNDSYQVVFPEDVALYRQVSAQTPTLADKNTPSAQIVALSGLGPTGVVGLNQHGSGVLVGGCTDLADDPIKCAQDDNRPAAIVSYTSIEKQGVYLNGRTPGWSLAVLQQLVASGKYVITYQDGFDWAVQRTDLPK